MEPETAWEGLRSTLEHRREKVERKEPGEMGEGWRSQTTPLRPLDLMLWACRGPEGFQFGNEMIRGTFKLGHSGGC